MCTFVSDYVCNCVCVCNVYMCVHVCTCGCVPLSRHIVGPLWTLPASGNLIVLAVPMAQSGWVDKPFLLCILTPTIQLINFIAFAMRIEWGRLWGVEGGGGAGGAGARMANDNRVPGIDILVNGMWINYLKTQNDMWTDSRGSYRRDIDGCGALIWLCMGMNLSGI